MSVRYQILKQLLKCSGMKAMFGLSQEALFAKAARYNARRGFAVPRDRACVYTDIPVGEDHCLKMQ